MTSLTKSQPYLFLKILISESEAGNLTCAINRNIKVAIRSAVDPNAIFNTRKPVIFQCTDLSKYGSIYLEPSYRMIYND